jgi:guanine deaminase
MTKQAYFADLLRFCGAPASGASRPSLSLMRDAVIVVDEGCITAVGPARDVGPHLPPETQRIDFSGKTLAPGFVDVHLHMPQLDVIASAADGLLPWLNDYTFPQEAKFNDPNHAAEISELFLNEMMRHGVTTGMVFCSAHRASVDAFFEASQARGLRMVAGKCLMDRHCPEGVRDDTEQSLMDSESLIQAWHGRARLGYALTPRFAPTSSDRQLQGAALLARRYPDVWVQSHVAENLDEMAWVKQLYPSVRSYLEVYERFGLLRPRSMYAHCLHLDEQDRLLMTERGASAAVCPTSNLFLGSGLFDFALADEAGFDYGLASDVGGGSSFSPFRTMLTAFEVARMRGKTLSPSELWYRHTLGAARAMGLGDTIGNLAPGYEADFVVLDAQATPLLARRSSLARSFEEWLFSFIVLADDRAISDTGVAGRLSKNIGRLSVAGDQR